MVTLYWKIISNTASEELKNVQKIAFVIFPFRIKKKVW